MSPLVLSEGAVFGPFEIRGQLGRGGMGVVYRAFDRRHDGEVALKLLAEQVAGDRVFAERFRREARAAFELRNPYVVPVHDFGEIDGSLYISMRLVDGRDLSAVLASGSLVPARAVGIVRQACHALGAAHRANLIHRDVKPSNLLIVEDHDDFTYLVDFGIAHVVGKHTVATSLTSTGATIGTLAYMAPERLRADQPIDGRVDIYALACVLFEMLTGRPPFPQTDHPGLISAHLFGPIPKVTDLRPDLSPAWDEVVARGLAKEPNDRYPTAQAFADDARRVLEGQMLPPVTALPGPVDGHVLVPETAVPPGPPPTHVPPQWAPAPAVPQPQYTMPSDRRPRRNGGSVVAVAASLVAVVLAATVVWLATQGVGNSSPRQDDTATGPTPTAPPSVAGSSPAPQATGSAGSVPPYVVQPQQVDPTQQDRRSGGDLGLSRTMDSVTCTGQYIVIVGSAVDPDAYRSDVQAFLERHPGTSYLLSEQNCSSLRQRMPSGASIYSVYYGPFSSLAEACATKRDAGGDSYVRRLDSSTPVGAEPRC